MCGGSGCPTLIDQGTRGGRCDPCRREQEQARGTRQQRGYDAEYDRTRAALLPRAYGTRCHFCGEFMWPHQTLALDHTEDRAGYRGIVHLSCNAADGGRRSHT